jgi:hypothetical protein
MRKPCLFLASVAVCLLCAGCKPSILGRWAGTWESPVGSIQMQFEFKEDGTMVGRGMAGEAVLAVEGKWELSKSGGQQTLTITFESAALNGVALEQQASTSISGPATIEKDRLTVTLQGEKASHTLELTRVKE